VSADYGVRGDSGAVDSTGGLKPTPS